MRIEALGTPESGIARWSISSWTSGSFAIAQQVDGEAVRCACLESYSASAASAAHADLEQAFMTAREATRERWPLYVAEHLDKVFRENTEACNREACGNALFAGVLVTADSVQVCTAGDLRVHLLSGGALARVTVDHVYVNDPFEPPLRELNPELTASLSTRWLGGAPSRPPNSRCWEATRPFTVIVCSSQLHQRRRPQDYLQMLLSRDYLAIALRAGLLVRIDALGSN